MPDVNAALAAAVGDLIAAAAKAGPAWTAPCAPGKWSPSQIVEHVALVLDEAANLASGAPSKFPKLPVLMRPLVRGLFFNRIVKKGVFPKSKAPKVFNPASGPATPATARSRLEAALGKFERACRARTEESPQVASTVFGKVSLQEYVRFQEVHTRHHLGQMPGGRPN